MWDWVDQGLLLAARIDSKVVGANTVDPVDRAAEMLAQPLPYDRHYGSAFFYLYPSSLLTPFDYLRRGTSYNSMSGTSKDLRT